MKPTKIKAGEYVYRGFAITRKYRYGDAGRTFWSSREIDGKKGFAEPSLSASKMMIDCHLTTQPRE